MRQWFTAVFTGMFGLGWAVTIAQDRATAPAGQETELRVVTMSGTVFEDLDADGVRDPGEPPLEGMPVSNGITIDKTPDTGLFTFQVNEQLGSTVFVCTPAGWKASRNFYAIADFDRFVGKTQSADIGLVRDPARLAERFCFVQLSDTHVTEDETRIRTMMEDLEVVNRLSDKPIFVAATGDLVNRGKRMIELESYVKATSHTKYPLYNVIGNHDYGGEARTTENYEKTLGPSYYSFSVGRCHFIAKDIIASRQNKNKQAYQQQEWIKDDIRLNAGDKRIIVLQHFLPQNDELDWWSQYDTAAIFSGHWHGQRERMYKGILDVNSAPLRFGGIDRSPRGFRIIHVDGKDLRCEWRVGQQSKRVEIIHPPIGGSVGGHAVNLRILAYDTAVRVAKVHYRITSDDGQLLAKGELAAEGEWSWAGRWNVAPGTVPGAKTIKIEVTDANGDHWQAKGTFNLNGTQNVEVTIGEDWPFFHGDAGHRGYVKVGPQPPLSMAWASHVPGTIHLASPVIADERVYVGTNFQESLKDCAVVALDLASGRLLWRAPVDSSIKHSLAVWAGNVLAVSQAATLYCFDRNGQPRWTSSLASERNNRWELSFPVTDGHYVFAGRCAGFGAYDLTTGKPIWNREGGGDWRPSVYSGPSLGSNVVYQGGPFVRALDPGNGDVLWNREKTVVSTVAVVPAVVERDQEGDRLYVFQNGKTLLCLDGKSSETIWQATHTVAKDGQAPAQVPVPLGNETGTPAVGEHVVCIGGAEVTLSGQSTSSAAMHGFDKQTGKLLWRYPVGSGVVSSVPYQRNEPTITSSPVIVGDVVYFGANDGYLYALDVNTGDQLWQYRLGVPIASTIAVTGNTIVVAAWDGTIYAFATEEET